MASSGVADTLFTFAFTHRTHTPPRDSVAAVVALKTCSTTKNIGDPCQS
jgi:hypothetical protein